MVIEFEHAIDQHARLCTTLKFALRRAVAEKRLRPEAADGMIAMAEVISTGRVRDALDRILDGLGAPRFQSGA